MWITKLNVKQKLYKLTPVITSEVNQWKPHTHITLRNQNEIQLQIKFIIQTLFSYKLEAWR